MTSLKAPSRVPLYLSLLVAFHIAIVIASNYLVQLPINLLGFHSTWGRSASRSSFWPPT